jgi:hypothetical protein
MMVSHGPSTLQRTIPILCYDVLKINGDRHPDAQGLENGVPRAAIALGANNLHIADASGREYDAFGIEPKT